MKKLLLLNCILLLIMNASGVGSKINEEEITDIGNLIKYEGFYSGAFCGTTIRITLPKNDETYTWTYVPKKSTKKIMRLREKRIDNYGRPSWIFNVLAPGSVKLDFQQEKKSKDGKIQVRQVRTATIEVSTPWTPLMRACLDGNTKLVQETLVTTPDLNAQTSDGTTALMLAAFGERTEILKLLLDAGADANIRNNEGQSARDIALKYDRKKIIQILDSQAATKIKTSKPTR